MVIGNHTSPSDNAAAAGLPADKPPHFHAMDIASRESSTNCFIDAVSAMNHTGNRGLSEDLAIARAATISLQRMDTVSPIVGNQMSFAPSPYEGLIDFQPRPSRTTDSTVLTAAVSTDAPAAPAQGDAQKQIADAQQALLAPNVSSVDKVRMMDYLFQSGVGTDQNPLQIRDRDGNVRNYVIEEQQAGNGRTMVHLFAQDDQGERHVVLRGVMQQDGSVQQERDDQGRFVAIEGAWWKQNMADRSLLVAQSSNTVDQTDRTRPAPPAPVQRDSYYDYDGSARSPQAPQLGEAPTAARRSSDQDDRPQMREEAPRVYADGYMPFRHYGETREEYMQRMGQRREAPPPAPYSTDPGIPRLHRQPPDYAPRPQSVEPGYRQGYPRQYEPGEAPPPMAPPPYSMPIPMPFFMPHRHRWGPQPMMPPPYGYDPYHRMMRPPNPYEQPRPPYPYGQRPQQPYERPPMRQPHPEHRPVRPYPPVEQPDVPLTPVQPGDLSRDNPSARAKREQLAEESYRIGGGRRLNSWCARGVHEALEGVGIHVTSADALQFGKNLLASGKFVVVPLRPENAQRGDIVVRHELLDPQSGRGDIFISQGDGTGTSDGQWRRITKDGETYKTYSGGTGGYDRSYVLRYVG